jgi:hypothetical protein
MCGAADDSEQFPPGMLPRRMSISLVLNASLRRPSESARGGFRLAFHETREARSRVGSPLCRDGAGGTCVQSPGRGSSRAKPTGGRFAFCSAGHTAHGGRDTAGGATGAGDAASGPGGDRPAQRGHARRGRHGGPRQTGRGRDARSHRHADTASDATFGATGAREQHRRRHSRSHSQRAHPSAARSQPLTLPTFSRAKFIAR